jgi:recombinational DNA repair protein RecR
MKHIEPFEFNKLNESLNYCKSCNSLSDNDLCNYCKILKIVGVTKERDNENIYGTLKYYKNFNKNDEMIKYVDELALKYYL